MGQLGRVPKAGDKVELKDAGARMRVEEMDKLRMTCIWLTRTLRRRIGRVRRTREYGVTSKVFCLALGCTI